MKLVKVQSSNVKAVGWEKEVLFVQYNNGIYTYDKVNKETYEELLKAESKGKYLNENIKNKYEFKKLDASELSNKSTSDNKIHNIEVYDEWFHRSDS